MTTALALICSGVYPLQEMMEQVLPPFLSLPSLPFSHLPLPSPTTKKPLNPDSRSEEHCELLADHCELLAGAETMSVFCTLLFNFFDPEF